MSTTTRAMILSSAAPSQRSPLISMSSNQNPEASQPDRKARSRHQKKVWRSNVKQNKSLAMAPEHTTALEQILLERGVYDTPEGLAARQEGLRALESLLCQWAQSLRVSRNKWQRPRVALVSFGSYRLGVNRPDADVDILALSPPHCSRTDFFESLVQILTNDQRVTELHPIAAAYTPVIKFCINGIAIDLLFARLNDGTKLLESPIPAASRVGEYMIDDSDLIGLDEPAMRSVNGARVAQMLLSLVPDLEAFRTTLRAVKEWASVHGLYSNVLGFLGGINWAILVAHVCRNNPDKSPPALLRLFFRTYASWNWPTPVTLGPLVAHAPSGVTPLPVWNPQTNPRDKLHLMPIITPAYPSMNSSYNVGLPQLRRLRYEFHEAVGVVERISHGTSTWSDLFRGNDFFERHFHFLQVSISALNASDFLEWFRLCESKLRLLVVGLETPDSGVASFPFAKYFDCRYAPSGKCLGEGKSDPDCKQGKIFFVAVRFAHGMDHVDLRFCTSDFLHKVNSWEGRRAGMDLTIKHVVKHDLPDFVLKQTGGKHGNVGSETAPPRKTSDTRPPPHRSGPLSPPSKPTSKSTARETGAATPPPTKRDPSIPSPAKRARKSNDSSS